MRFFNKQPLLLTAMLVSSAISTPTFAATTYQLELSPGISGSCYYPKPVAINQTGIVLANTDCSTDVYAAAALKWDASGVITALTATTEGADGSAVAINQSGQALIVDKAQLYLLNNGVRTLVQTGLTKPVARTMNDAAAIVGYSEISAGNFRAFVYQNGASTTLPTLPSGSTSSAQDINNSGVIVGNAFDANNQTRATLWRNGAITNLGTLPGDTESTAYAINDNDQVAGISTGANGTRGFIWQNGVMSELGTFGNNKYVRPYDINQSGQIVGLARPSNSVFSYATAFVWSNGEYRDLNPVIGKAETYGCEANAISNSGHVTGSCINDMFRLTPIADGVDISIGMTTSSDTARVNQALIYTLQVSNTGSLPATGVTLTDTLPLGVSFNSVSSTQGSCSANSIINCALGNLAAGATATVTLSVKPTVTTFNLSNTAYVFANETDVNPINNTATSVKSVYDAIIVTDVSVSIAGSATVKLNTNITYTITVKNAGPGTTPYVTVSNNVAANLYFVSSTTTSGSCGGVSCTLGQLAAGETATVTLVLRPLKRSTYTSKSTVYVPTSDNTSNNTASITTVVK